MIPDIRRHLHNTPFEPFTIVTGGGDKYTVVTSDHAGINPTGTRVVVWFDDGSSVTISDIHIVAIEKNPVTVNHPA